MLQPENALSVSTADFLIGLCAECALGGEAPDGGTIGAQQMERGPRGGPQAKPGVAITVAPGAENLDIPFEQRGYLVGGQRVLSLASEKCPTNASLVRTFTVKPTGGTAVARGNCP